MEIQIRLYLKCGCRMDQDVPQNNPKKPGDWCYCARHGDVRAVTKDELVRNKKCGGRTTTRRENS